MADEKSDLLRSLSIDETARRAPTGRRGPGGILLLLLALILAGGAGLYIFRADLAGLAQRALSSDGAGSSTAGSESAGGASSAPVRAPGTGPAAQTNPAQTNPAQTTPARATPGPGPQGPVVPRSRGLIASGYVVARRRATVSAELTGRLVEVYVEEGARVEKDQILARLDSRLAELDLELAEARAAVQDANASAIEADLREARAALSRAQDLAERNFSSRADLDLARARANGLAARLEAARAEARVARVSAERQAELVDRFAVRAPFSGVIIDKNAQVGEIISPTSAGGGFTRTGVYTLVDMDSLEIEVDVNEGQIQNIRPGQSATAVLDAYPDVDFPAQVIAIIPTANRDRATIQVRVGFDRLDPRILPEMAAKVTFSLE